MKVNIYIQVVNEKQLWKKQSRVDHIKHDYEKRGKFKH